MTKTRLYIVVMEKAMFNTIGRHRFQSDTPLTEAGERGVRGRTYKVAFLLKRLFQFWTHHSSHGVNLFKNSVTGEEHLSCDKRIREWCLVARRCL